MHNPVLMPVNVSLRHAYSMRGLSWLLSLFSLLFFDVNCNDI